MYGDRDAQDNNESQNCSYQCKNPSALLSYDALNAGKAQPRNLIPDYKFQIPDFQLLKVSNLQPETCNPKSGT